MLRQQLVRLSTRRGFSSTIRQQAHFEEGVYSNIPVKVKNRRIPYGWVHFGFFGAGFAFPFFACFVQQKKQGLI
ncbi:COX8 (YLR395C) [Zygosaccharomyces parabailii]|uniref:Cytochrome c oxidase subunit 8, mitochondrial n=1 Tax=Zygosaccharomyces bailii (strain CLIB 213 / ATCC 58445 / CBS 680 / BCRC 21525 / NBRC 1098 / NCYC 1416 / NRRL Y-2227) TaxID=1333698 RepID=A0A8J2TCI4_ZYGB2|nr:COX8 (YLR395C) [Zygosaccharomyces parabailii]AQZ18271.1 COX8 (YLR395C) [Zygosaccharomyces parabailii]CDF91388.1 ZYBA0S11-01750g1_1 [Zygosaccharomyces bailii CLIB 213]SJM86874.1 related to Cytochrome c oxidase polypeptide VIII, mitochondrial [Zygosaccharomyces bailii]